MVGGEGNSYPIQLLVNYWEVRPALMGARLDELLRRGVAHIATFVPWQAVESDISHSLTRFLLAASDRNMTLSLILTPEVGVHYPFSGLPKDVILKPENFAQSSAKTPVTVSLPPNAFSLPSLMAPEFSKRYYSFLSRMDNLLADFKRTHGRSLGGVNVVLSGSYWKYYRAASASAAKPFAGAGGDYSGAAAIEYRQKVDYFYSQPEFSDPTPAAANRWKTRAMEDVNRRWFNQQSEAVFRNRTMQMVRKKAAAAGVREIELFTPESDPGHAYSHFLQMVSGEHGDFARLSRMVDESAAFSSAGSLGPAGPCLHWSSLGAFRTLSDSEKQFLILKSLLLMGGSGGGVLIDEEEWFALSKNFRARAEAFGRLVMQGELRLRTRALYLTSHLWSGAGPLWNFLFSELRSEARRFASLDLLLCDREARLAIVDPSCILTHQSVQKLISWAKSGRIVVLPRTSNYTEMARSEIELAVARGRRMDLDLGVRYRLHELGDGKLVIHDIPTAANPSEAAAAWNTFVSSILSLAEIQPYCKLSDGRLETFALAKRGQGVGLFVLNPTRRQVSADIVFQNPVVVSDLAVQVSGVTPPPPPVAQQGQAVRPPAPPVAPAQRFSLDVPPGGILPLSVSGMGFSDTVERLEAALSAEATRKAADLAALSELPGFEEPGIFGEDSQTEAGGPAPWN